MSGPVGNDNWGNVISKDQDSHHRVTEGKREDGGTAAHTSPDTPHKRQKNGRVTGFHTPLRAATRQGTQEGEGVGCNGFPGPRLLLQADPPLLEAENI